MSLDARKPIVEKIRLKLLSYRDKLQISYVEDVDAIHRANAKFFKGADGIRFSLDVAHIKDV